MNFTVTEQSDTLVCFNSAFKGAKQEQLNGSELHLLRVLLLLLLAILIFLEPYFQPLYFMQ